MKKIIPLLLLLAACNPNSLEDFQHEGESICRSLIEDLRQVQTREELLQRAPKLKKHFEELVDLMIEAKKFQEYAEEEFSPIAGDNSEQLSQELRRIYQLEAGRETIEKAQSEALLRLDAFHRSLQKKKSKVK